MVATSDGLGQFPMTRACVPLIREATPGVSAGILFRWGNPAAWHDYSLDGQLVSDWVRFEAIKRFREAYEEAKSHGGWAEWPKPPIYMKGARIKFRGMSENEVRDLWSSFFYPWFSKAGIAKNLVRFVSVPGGTVLDASEALKLDDPRFQRAAQRPLLAEDRNVQVFLREEELLINPHGWELHADRLARILGLTSADVARVVGHCGSLVEHLIHADTCKLPVGEFGEDLRSRLSTMTDAVRTMRTSAADEALVVVLGLWHEARDHWAINEVVVGSETKTFPGRWIFVRNTRVLDVLTPTRSFQTRTGADAVRSFLLPLAVLGRLSVGPKVIDFGAPLLSDLYDCRDSVAIPDRGGLEAWVTSLPEKERTGFCVQLGQALRERIMPSFQPDDGKRQWGPSAVRAATKELPALRRTPRRYDEDDEAADEKSEALVRLKARSQRTRGYFDYPWGLTILAMANGWGPDTRAFARSVFFNLVSKPPKWRHDEDIEVVEGLRYWAKQLRASESGADAGLYYPALGSSTNPWTLDAWLLGSGYARTKAEITAAVRLAWLDDLEQLNEDLHLTWRLTGLGHGVQALKELRSMARNPTRWARVRIELLLPVKSIEDLYDWDSVVSLLDDEEEHGEDGAPTPRQEPGIRSARTLSKRMHACGLTQQELAQLVGCSPSMISQVISGKKRISDDLAEKSHAVLGRRGKTPRLNLNFGKNVPS